MDPLSIDILFSQCIILWRRQELYWVAIRVGLSSFIVFHTVRSAENWLCGSVIEIQAFLVALVQKFDISLADHCPQIRSVKSGLMIPVVLGEEHKGTQLPLKITAVGSM